MITTAPRDMTWEQLREHLDGPRLAIWEWLRHHGPATTTEISAGTAIGLLTVRPRVSELAVLGFVECIDRRDRQGVYRHLTVAQAQTFHGKTRDPQTHLKLS